MFRYIKGKTVEAVEWGKKHGIRFTSYTADDLNERSRGESWRKIKRIARDEFGLRTTGKGATRVALTDKIVDKSRSERNWTYGVTISLLLAGAGGVYSLSSDSDISKEPETTTQTTQRTKDYVKELRSLTRELERGRIDETQYRAGIVDLNSRYDIKPETQPPIQVPAERSAGQPPQQEHAHGEHATENQPVVQLGPHGEFMRNLFQGHYDRSWEATKENVRGMKAFGEAVLDGVDGYVREEAESIRPRIEDMIEARRQKANAVLEGELNTPQEGAQNPPEDEGAQNPPEEQ